MSQFKCKLKSDAVEALHDCLQLLLTTTELETDEDRLHFACLGEVKKILYLKLAKVQLDYQLTFTVSQAIAMRMLSTYYITDVSTFLGNKLHQLSNQINQQYL